MLTCFFKVADLADYPRKIISDGKQKICFATVGGNTIVRGAKVVTATCGHVLIGNYTTVGNNVEFVLNECSSKNKVFNFVENKKNSAYHKNQIIVGSDVVIGDNVRIVGGVIIGDGAIIHDNAVVYNDISPYCEIKGDPAYIIKKRFQSTIINKLEKIKWWHWSSERIKESEEYFDNPAHFVDRFYPELSLKHDGFSKNGHGAIDDVTIKLELLLKQVKKIRKEDYQIIYYVLDDTDEISLWKSVVVSFMDEIEELDKVCMLIEVSHIHKKTIINEILHIAEKANVLNNKIFIVKRESLNEVAIDFLKLADVLITSSDYSMIKYVDYAQDLNLEIISSYDKNVFSFLKNGGRDESSKKEEPPLLTIGIPTYNRSEHLRKCLNAIYTQIGNDMRFEVYVSDNASEDETPDIAAEYASLYKNFYYYRQEKNILDKNLKFIWTHPHGKFVWCLGDDDYPTQGTCYHLLKAIVSDPDAVLITMNITNDEYVKNGSIGVSEFISELSYLSTSISCTVFNTGYMDVDKVECLLRQKGFKYPSFLQTCMALEAVSTNKRFTSIGRILFTPDSGDADRWTPMDYDRVGRSKGLGDLGRIFIGEYLDVLKMYFSKGLDEYTYKEEKKKLIEFIYFYTRLSVMKKTRWGAMRVMEYYCKYYSDEPYFEKVKKELKTLVDKLDPTIKESVKEVEFDKINT